MTCVEREAKKESTVGSSTCVVLALALVSLFCSVSNSTSIPASCIISSLTCRSFSLFFTSCFNRLTFAVCSWICDAKVFGVLSILVLFAIHVRFAISATSPVLCVDTTASLW
eukprot:TRINITY_DN2920_c0_g1_i20.p1 TRINITY_DN2920_c0_g1~~TRINITY_DN2920_c0_g1_i20.p1  ORF type:complete len:112 (+),score=8.33 TRINITY_DN2920_c0_g1_i20:317-652(+)